MAHRQAGRVWEPYPDPGKYEGEPLATEALDALDADDELGDTETIGHYRLYVDVPLNELTDPEGRPLSRSGETISAILLTDSQGFVSGDFFTGRGHARKARARWAELESEAEEAAGPGDEDVTADDPGGPFYYLGRVVAEDRAGLKRWMKREGYYPNVWWISDHGNPHRIDDL